MKKILLPLATCLWTFLLAFALPVPSPAAPLSTPSLSKDDAALVAKVNSLYYNYMALGLRKFKCRVQINAFDNVVELFKSKKQENDPSYKALKDIRFFITYSLKDGFNFNYTGYKPTGDSATDTNLAKMLEEIHQIVDGFWKSWSSITLEPAIDTGKSAITVSQIPSGYEIDEKKDTSLTKNFLNSDLVVTEVDGYNADKPDPIAVIKPGFTKTSNGLLLNSMKADLAQTLSENVTINYQKIQKFQFPSKVELNLDMSAAGTKSDILLQFSDYQVN
jgi:hypothetical protein